MKRLGDSTALTSAGSLRFEVGSVRGRYGEVPIEGFVIRTTGGVRGYLNVCPHRGQPVDLGDGKLFSIDGLLECQAHGAYFDPLSGECVRGACPGRSLRALDVRESEGALWLDETTALPVADPD